MYDAECTMYETLVRTINNKLNQISSNVTFKVPHLPILPMNNVKKSSKHANFPKVINFWKVFKMEITVISIANPLLSHRVSCYPRRF
jgi:hypothetical protein